MICYITFVMLSFCSICIMFKVPHQTTLTFGHSKKTIDKLSVASHPYRHMIEFGKWCSFSTSSADKEWCNNFHTKNSSFGGRLIDQKNFQKGSIVLAALFWMCLKPALAANILLQSPDRMSTSSAIVKAMGVDRICLLLENHNSLN